MSQKNIQFNVTGPKADLRPLLVRIGGPDVESFDCPQFPKWVEAANGSRVLVQDAAEEADATKPEPAPSGTLKLNK